MEPAANVFGPILAISGSLRRDSITSAALRAAAAAARDGIAARIDDSPRAPPHFDPDLEPFPPEAVLRFRRVCADGTGVLARRPGIRVVWAHVDRRHTHDALGFKRQGGYHGANETPRARGCRLAYSMTEVNM